MSRPPRLRIIERAWLAFARCVVALLLLSVPTPCAGGVEALLQGVSEVHSHEGQAARPAADTDGCPCCEAAVGPCTSCAEEGPCSSCPPGCPGCAAAGGRYAPSVGSPFVLPDAAFAALIGIRAPIVVAPQPDQTAPYRPPRTGAAVA